MKPSKKKICIIATLIMALGASGNVFALKPGCDAPPCGGGNEPPIPTESSNNLSFPVIWSDGVIMPGFVQSTEQWVFATVYPSDGTTPVPYTKLDGSTPVPCITETDITPPMTVDTATQCYFGRKNLGDIDEDGEPDFEGEPESKRVWWLQQRQPNNAWQVFNAVDPKTSSPVVVTGVDTGDLLESSTSIKAKQIRTEFTLLKRIAESTQLGSVTDEDFADKLATAFGDDNTCALEDNLTYAPNNCFAALNMSGAVPGTDQSIAEIQGTDYGSGDVDGNNLPGEMILIDPQTIKVVKNYFDPTKLVITADDPDPRIVPVEPAVGVDATVYSGCARLLIQKISGSISEIYWDSVEHSWMPRSVINAPVIDLRTWESTYTAEINAGGSVIYGYNWNTKNASEGSGTYRLTFVLEGNTSNGGLCTNSLNTVFDDSSLSVNVGASRPATIVSQSALGGTAGEGGAVYVDIDVIVGGGGK